MYLETQSQDPLHEITDQILRSYADVTAIHHLEQCPLPSREIIINVLADLMEIIYPGYRHRDKLNSSNVRYYVGELTDRLCNTLTIQISRAFCHGNKLKIECTPEKKESFEVKGREKAIEFLKKIPQLRRLLAMDVKAAYDGDPACTGFEEVIFCYPALQAITIYRLAHVLHQLEVPLIPRIMTEYAHSMTGIDIHPGAEIGNFFFIDHGTGVVIGETCHIGNWVKLYQGVTLGALSFQKDSEGHLVHGNQRQRHPTIEDNVVIYANATILGGNTVIGHHSVIGANVWLDKSVDPYYTVTIKEPQLNHNIRKPG